MKNQTKLFGITALVAVIIFSMTACDTGGGSTVTAKMRASNNNGTKPARSIARAVYTGSQIDTASFSALDSYYNGLGTRTSQHTPTKFELYYVLNAISSTGDSVVVGEGLFDFTQNLTINFGEIPTDITCSAIFLQLYGTNPKGGSNPVIVANGQTLNFGNLTGLDGPGLEILAFGAGVSQVKLYNSQAVPLSALVPGASGSNFALSSPSNSKIVFPFEAKTISGSASSVTLSLSFDLTNIIELYPSSKYTLRKGWWESVDLFASVQ